MTFLSEAFKHRMKKLAINEQLNKCSRCGGTGKVGFTIDDGICYKCDGTGYVGGTPEEIEAAIKTRESKNKIPKAKHLILRSVVKAIGVPSSELPYYNPNEQIYPSWIAISLLKYQPKSFTFKWPEMVPYFKEPYVDNYDNITDVMNPTEETLKQTELLRGKSCTISSVDNERIKVSFS